LLYFVPYRDKKVVGVSLCVFRAPASNWAPSWKEEEKKDAPKAVVAE
jgi:hypothetical protein